MIGVTMGPAMEMVMVMVLALSVAIAMAITVVVAGVADGAAAMVVVLEMVGVFLINTQPIYYEDFLRKGQ
jgi:hypothetical protein